MTYHIISKQKNEGLYLIDWISWHIAIGIHKFDIISNDCTDGSSQLLDTIQNEFEGVCHSDVTSEALDGRSIGTRTIQKINQTLTERRGDFVITMDIDEFLSFRDNNVSEISSLSFDEQKTYSISWLNCIPSNLVDFVNEPAFVKNNCAITKTNPKFPYAIGFNGKQMCFNRDGVQLANYHHFSVNDKEVNQGEASPLFIKHCVTNSIDEFALRSERGESSGFAKKAGEFKQQGQDIAAREANNYKYAIDLFLMYASQGITSNIQTNPVITKKASEVKAELLSNPKIKAAQNKIDEYYNRKFKEIQKGYVSSVVKKLELTHIDKLNTKELRKFNAQFFKKNQKKPHDYYVLMTLSCLFEEDFEQARQFCAYGLQNYASVKLLAMMRSPILRAPFITYP